jgi:hypothetical protein
MSFDDVRRAAADQAFDLYDMGDMTIEDTGGWDWHAPDEVKRAVFVADEVDEDGHGVSMKLTFVVRFKAGTAEVEDAYFAC